MSGKWYFEMSVKQLKTRVFHWRFEDGLTSPNAGHPDPRMVMEPSPRGWYCWVYPADRDAFAKWMEENCPTADIAWRFNSGDPMYTVEIWDDKEAMTFMLRWDIK